MNTDSPSRDATPGTSGTQPKYSRAERRDDTGLISQAIRRLGGTSEVDKLPTVEDDHTIDGDGRVLAHTDSDERIFELQRQYRRLDVISSPDPLLLLEVSKPPQKREIALLLICGNENLAILERIIPHLKRKYQAVEKLLLPAPKQRSEKDIAQLMLKSRTSRYILAAGLDRIYTSLVLGSGTPFCILNSKCGKYSNYITQLGLNQLIMEAENYQQFKSLFLQAYSFSQQVGSKIATILEAERRKSAATQRTLSTLRNIGELLPLTTEVHCKINFHCNPRNYRANPWMTTLAEQLSNYSCNYGLYLELSIYRSMVVGKRYHLYPWIGILEIGMQCQIAALLSSSEWRESSRWCRGLLLPGSKGTTRNIRSLLRSTGIPCQHVPIPLLDVLETFNHGNFIMRPRLCHFRESTVTLSLPTPEEDQPSESESSEDSDSEISGQSESDSSEDDIDSTLFPEDDEEDEGYGGEVEVEAEFENGDSESGDERSRKPLKQLLAESDFQLGDDEDDEVAEGGMEKSSTTENNNSEVAPGDVEVDTSSTAVDRSTAAETGEGGGEKHHRNEKENAQQVRPPLPPLQGEPQPSVEGTYYYYQSRPREIGADLRSLETCIPIVEGDDIGLLIQALSRNTPPVVHPTELNLQLLGSDYPLYTESLDPETLHHICTVSRVNHAVQHIAEISSKMACEIPRFLKQLEKMK